MPSTKTGPPGWSLTWQHPIKRVTGRPGKGAGRVWRRGPISDWNHTRGMFKSLLEGLPEGPPSRGAESRG
jgi:hypothetical protein